jgi:hypothetical protein
MFRKYRGSRRYSLDYFPVSLQITRVSRFLVFIGKKIARVLQGLPLDLPRLMASSCRQKIIAVLATVRQTHIMDLVRKVNSTYNQVNRNLQILEHEEIVESHHYGRMRLIRLNRQSPKTKAILHALRILREQNRTLLRDKKTEKRL